MKVLKLIAIIYPVCAVIWGTAWAMLAQPYKGEELNIRTRIVGGAILGVTWPVSYPIAVYCAVREGCADTHDDSTEPPLHTHP